MSLTLTPPEPIAEHHETNEFQSGEDSLDIWLKRRARSNQVSGASRTFVACQGNKVMGYYALAAGAVFVANASGRFKRNMPDPIPVVILARLAVDKACQGQGIGRALFRDCAQRVARAADVIGIRGVVVHALSEEARRFYIGLGFEGSPGDPNLLMVTLADLRAAFKGAS
jgi:GNAT superfamily N-acetyltransferase